MRKTITVLALAAVASLTVPSSAAVNLAVAAPGGGAVGTYATPTVVLVKAAPLNLINTDIESHDIVSTIKRNGKHIFKSAVAPTGGVVPVEGVASLEVGTYEFYCSLHPNMVGTLDVRG